MKTLTRHCNGIYFFIVLKVLLIASCYERKYRSNNIERDKFRKDQRFIFKRLYFIFATTFYIGRICNRTELEGKATGAGHRTRKQVCRRASVGFIDDDIVVERVIAVLIAAELDRANSLSALNEMTCLHMERRRTGRR